MKMNKIMFAVGLIIALIAALMMFEGQILGERTTGIATVVGIVGICLIAGSGHRVLKK